MPGGSALAICHCRRVIWMLCSRKTCLLALHSCRLVPWIVLQADWSASFDGRNRNQVIDFHWPQVITYWFISRYLFWLTLLVRHWRTLLATKAIVFSNFSTGSCRNGKKVLCYQLELENLCSVIIVCTFTLMMTEGFNWNVMNYETLSVFEPHIALWQLSYLCWQCWLHSYCNIATAV